MMNRSRLDSHRLRVSHFAILFLVATACIGSAHAEKPSDMDLKATELLPETIVAYAEAADVGTLVETILNHPLRKRLESMPAYDAVIASGGLDKLQQAIGAFEATMGQPWRDAIATLANGGVSIALDSTNGGIAVLIKSSDADTLTRFGTFLLAIGKMQQANGLATKQVDYRGFMAYEINNHLKMAVVDHWLFITNRSELGKAVIDRYLDRPKNSLHTSEWFRLAMAELDSQDTEQANADVAAVIDVEAIRNAGIAKALYADKSENPAAELLLGGIAANLRQTAYATASFAVRQQGLRIQVSTPHKPAWEPPREYFFGTAPPLLHVDQQLFAVSAHRDLSQMWLRAGDLMSDKANDGIAKADAQLTTFFSGRDFGEDILGSLKSEIQMVGRVQDFTDVLPQPAIKLPAFALQFRMKDATETQPELRRVFQSFVGFLNVVGAMEGKPQLDLNMESLGDAQLVSASYVPDRDQRESMSVSIHYNFSPTIAFAGDKMVISSSTSLAKELVGNREKSGSVPLTSQAPSSFNTIATIEAKTLQQILQANKAQLVANNMLEKGHREEAAEEEIGSLLELVGFFKNAQIDLAVTDSHLRLAAELNFDTDHAE